ncbi:hypothetical protein Taro_040087 [Colocasia esculenta]|uniref:UBN2 domain-containing protein n=1 Tax=Colocasia esculenta TaxID=4460 RepID=A0A843WC92_COLES|nr:hypothetical protein [Colocasia esculenta]
MTCEAHPFFFQVRESKRIHIPPVVLVSTIVESGPRHQQKGEDLSSGVVFHLGVSSAKNMCDKLTLTYEGTKKVRETKVDILIDKYDKFKMTSRESISEMYGRFTDIINGLVALGKMLSTYDMFRKLLCTIPALWKTKVTTIEEAKDL